MTQVASLVRLPIQAIVLLVLVGFTQWRLPMVLKFASSVILQAIATNAAQQTALNA